MTNVWLFVQEATKVLQDEVKELEDKYRSLTSARSHPDQAIAATQRSGDMRLEDEIMDGGGAMTRATTDAHLDRIDVLKQQCATMSATSEQLRKEAVKMQSVLVRHQEFARVVQETFDDELLLEEVRGSSYCLLSTGAEERLTYTRVLTAIVI